MSPGLPRIEASRIRGPGRRRRCCRCIRRGAYGHPAAQPGNLITLDSSFTSIFRSAATANFQTNYDTIDTLFGQTNALSSANGLSSVSTSFDQTMTVGVSSPYSLSMFITFYPEPYAHPTLDGELDIASVPESASAALLGVGTAGLGLRRRQINRAMRSA